MNITHKKIAELAGVSQSTVSKALSKNKEISEETIEAVNKIAEKNGYFAEKKNYKKRNVKNISPTIAVLCPEIISPYYASIVTRLQYEFEKFGGKTAAYICGFDPKTVNGYIKNLEKEKNIDAIVICYCTETYEKKTAVPLLYMVKTSKTSRYDAVFHSIYEAVGIAVKYLKELGHKEIGFIGELNTSIAFDAFTQAMKEFEIPTDERYIYTIKKRFAEIGYKAAELILQKKCIPTAFITAYDEIALGAIRDLKSGGFIIPRDISFIGLNDTPASSYGETPLTTINHHIDEQCAIAAKLLKTKIFDCDYTAVQHVSIKNELIIRQTTAPPPQ